MGVNLLNGKDESAVIKYGTLFPQDQEQTEGVMYRTSEHTGCGVSRIH